MKKALMVGFLSLSPLIMAANLEPVIYGTVITTKDEKVTGTLRWGDQEMWLSDIFNGRKVKTIGIEHFTEEQIQALEDHQPGPQARMGGLQITFKSFFGNEVKLPYYNLPFGAISQLAIDTNKGKYQATLHDGVVIDADGDTNDLTDDIFVLTADGNTVEFDMDEIKAIQFSQAPTDAKRFDQGIYGIVTTKNGQFQGRFMWDKDERALSEELDGNEADGTKHKIKFKDIKSIERQGDRSLVVLNDGQSLLLGGTNDVDSSHRGLWFYNPDIGRHEILWDDFVKFEMTDIPLKWLTYSDYQQYTKPLSGNIKLANDSAITVSEIAFDLNQQSGHELLEVEVNGIETFIPFRNISKITQSNPSAVSLLLTNGETVIAYGTRSVTRDNNGLFVTEGNEKRWIMWQDVQSIEFN
ncbi:MAG: hypothetical protein R3E90_09340 [Marinicella sp.]|nr:hypothetical protein [Xanthomonadales bacterium]